jgi:hypothetical protein
MRRRGGFLGACALALAGCLALTSTSDLTSPSEPDGSTANSAADSTADGGAETSVESDAGPNEDANPSVDAEAGCPTAVLANLVGMWRFEDDVPTKIADCTANHLDGLISGPATRAAGHHGFGLSFGGNSYATVGNPSPLQLTGAVTVAAWVDVRNLASNPRILAKGGASQINDEAVDLRVEMGTYAFGVGTSGSTSLNVSGGTVDAGAWRHVVGVFRPSTSIDVYVDGQLVGSTPVDAGAMRNSGNDYWIGRRPGDGCCSLDGVVDDVRIYDRALTADEIATIAAE